MAIVESSLTSDATTFHVEAYEKIDYTLTYVDGVFDPANTHLADIYRPWGRCLMVIDDVVDDLYGERARAYFAAHDIALTTYRLVVDETTKAWTTVEGIVDAFADFGLVRKEQPLVVGGGLGTDVAGFACASFRRSTPYVRIPTTLIGLIDASVSIKVGVNHRKYKNRLGAYHASSAVLLDFGFLATLPVDQVRNGMAEIIKISTVGDKRTFDLMDAHGEALLATHFGHVDGEVDGQWHAASAELREVAHEITYRAIQRMLELEVPNLHELDLDRVIAFGHTWSPTLELAPEVPFFHGHAITIDMALSTTLAEQRGHVTAEERDRVLSLMSRIGLSLDSEHLTPELLERSTRAILQTRDGRLRAAVPAPVGECVFLDDVSADELVSALDKHRTLVADLPRAGAGVQAFVDEGLPA
jgi:demethyl-4-deoxygadusol synthase